MKSDSLTCKKGNQTVEKDAPKRAKSRSPDKIVWPPAFLLVFRSLPSLLSPRLAAMLPLNVLVANKTADAKAKNGNQRGNSHHDHKYIARHCIPQGKSQVAEPQADDGNPLVKPLLFRIFLFIFRWRFF